MRRRAIRSEADKPWRERGFPIVQGVARRRRHRKSLITSAAQAVTFVLSLFGFRL